MHVFAQVSSEATGARFTLEQVENMAQGMLGRMAQCVATLHIRQELFGYIPAAGYRVLIRKHDAIRVGQEVGVLVSLATNHHAIYVAHVLVHLVQSLHATVKDDLHMRKGLLDGIGALIDERGYLPVFLGRQPGKDGLAGMNGEAAAAGLFHAGHKPVEKIVIILVINADAGLYRHRHTDGCLHGFHALAHQFRLGHQNGADLALLHPIRRAAHIEIDLVVPVLLGNSGRFGQIPGLAAAKLQGYRMLFVIERQKPLTIPAQYRLGHHHFGIEQGVAGNQPGQKPVVPGGPVHHRRHGQASVRLL